MKNYIMILLKISLGKKDDKQRSLDECVKDKHKECTDALQVIYSWLYFKDFIDILNPQDTLDS